MRGLWIFDLTACTLRGSINLCDAFAFTLARFAPKPIDLEFSGVRFDHADHILWSLVADIFISKVYTPQGFEIKVNDVVVDVGAHKGVFVAYAAQRTRKRIKAFEPDKNNFAYLQSLIEKHAWDYVDLVNAALIGQPIDEVLLYTSESSSRHSIFGEDVVTGRKLTNSQRVPAMILEEALKDVTHIDLLKMDCEGAEFPILLSANPAVFSRIDKIVIEYHSPQGSDDLRKLLQKLKGVYRDVTIHHTLNMSLGYIYAKN